MSRRNRGSKKRGGSRDLGRGGLTLLEVVLAVAILAGSFTMLSQLVGIGMRAAANGRDLTRAQLLAESAMSEIAAGIVQAQSTGAVTASSDPRWIVSAVTEPTIHQGIVRVIVVAEEDTNSLKRTQFVLTRWLRDPLLEIPEEEEVASAASSGGSSASGGGDVGGGTGGAGGGAGGGGAGAGGGNQNGGGR